MTPEQGLVILVTLRSVCRTGPRFFLSKNGGLDQYGTEPFEQQQFGTVGIGGVNVICHF